VLEKNWTFERVVRILYQAEQNIFAQLWQDIEPGFTIHIHRHDLAS
jgi:hypothetical protein